MIIRNEVNESLTLKFAKTVSEYRNKGNKIISFGLGEPDFNVPKEIINSTIKVLETCSIGYSDPMGILSLRNKIANKLKLDNAINCNSENILITAGAKQAFQLSCMALLEPKDEVIIINPSFVSFIPQVLISEPNAIIKVVDISKKDFSIDINVINKIVGNKTKLLVVNTPNNPAGYVLDSSFLKELYKMACEYDFYIISDEIYEKLIFTNLSHFSIGSLEDYPQRVFTINGFSKSHGMTGWRVGYVCFPLKFKEKLLKLQQHINTNTCTFIQLALSESFDLDFNYLNVYNETLKKRLSFILYKFSNLSKVSIVPPQAGFFAFMNISKSGLDSNSFCSLLLEETGVATTPGIAFGKNWDDHVRISFAVDDNLLIEGLDLMTNFINKL